MRAAGLEHRRLYDRRHAFATWSIESGVPSLAPGADDGHVQRADRDTYARWMKRTDEQLRAAFDAYDKATG